MPCLVGKIFRTHGRVGIHKTYFKSFLHKFSNDYCTTANPRQNHDLEDIHPNQAEPRPGTAAATGMRHAEIPAPKPKRNNTASYKIKPYKLHLLETGPSITVAMTRTEALQYYRKMTTIREMAKAAEKLFRDGFIRGRCHHHTGQEASCVGVQSAITPEDSMMAFYRTMGWSYVRGTSLDTIFGELAGRACGMSNGKAGSMLMRGPNLYGGNSIVGNQVPIGAGLAFAHKYRNEKYISVTVYGDGASNQGQVYETFNMAKLWGLPCVFLCENNGYSLFTNMQKGSACTTFYKKGNFIPGIWVDGMDVLAVREAVRFARDFALNQGPIIVELEMYLQLGHSISHPGTFARNCEEVEQRKQRDPIDIHLQRMTSSNLASNQELTVTSGDAFLRQHPFRTKEFYDEDFGVVTNNKTMNFYREIEAECKREVELVAEGCKTYPLPEIKDMYADVYCSIADDFRIRGCDPLSYWQQNSGGAQRSGNDVRLSMEV